MFVKFDVKLSLTLSLKPLKYTHLSIRLVSTLITRQELIIIIVIIIAIRCIFLIVQATYFNN